MKSLEEKFYESLDHGPEERSKFRKRIEDIDEDLAVCYDAVLEYYDAWMADQNDDTESEYSGARDEFLTDLSRVEEE